MSNEAPLCPDQPSVDEPHISRTAIAVAAGSLTAIVCWMIIQFARMSPIAVPVIIPICAAIILSGIIGCAIYYSIGFAIRDSHRPRRHRKERD